MHPILRSYRQINLGLIVWLLAGLNFLSFGSLTSVKAASDTGWQDTNIQIPSNARYCTDPTHPDVLIMSGGGFGSPSFTTAYNLRTGQTTPLNTELLSTCASNGFLYAGLNQGDGGTPIRFSIDNPQGIILAHRPIAIAQNGSLDTYALDHSDWNTFLPNDYKATQTQNHLWYSPDGGLTWQERAQNLTGVFFSLVVSPSNSHSIYLLTRSLQLNLQNNAAYTVTIYHSADAGANWEMRSQFPYIPYYENTSLQSFTSLNTPETTLMRVDNEGSHEGINYSISLDGGRTFKEITHKCSYDCDGGGAYTTDPALFFGARNLLYLMVTGIPNPTAQDNYALKALQTDGSWQTIPIPAEIQAMYTPSLKVANNEPNNIFLSAYSTTHSGTPVTWYSPDSGQTWQKLPGNMDYVAPGSNAPLTLLGVGNTLNTLNMASADKSLTQPAPASGSADGPYYSATNHNISPLFKSYWESHGGLAQFGYPRTEALREVNPADGKIYTVQYFERNRFEYHPEFAGTPYEVELGLLGNQLTESRRAAGDGAFNHFDDMHYPGGTYFAATGHNLRNSFKIYWESHGGLALYGYPISEEFNEVNPDDGQTYVVQYFERNRFEYHPENKGTQYEVELGLLGNTLLKQKGWL